MYKLIYFANFSFVHKRFKTFGVCSNIANIDRKVRDKTVKNTFPIW